MKMIKKLMIRKILAVMRKACLIAIFERSPVLNVPEEKRYEFNKYFDWDTYSYKGIFPYNYRLKTGDLRFDPDLRVVI